VSYTTSKGDNWVIGWVCLLAIDVDDNVTLHKWSLMSSVTAGWLRIRSRFGVTDSVAGTTAGFTDWAVGVARLLVWRSSTAWSEAARMVAKPFSQVVLQAFRSAARAAKCPSRLSCRIWTWVTLCHRRILTMALTTVDVVWFKRSKFLPYMDFGVQLSQPYRTLDGNSDGLVDCHFGVD